MINIYKFIGKKNRFYETEQKLNANCKQEEKNGTGPGSCGGASGKSNSDKPALTSSDKSNEPNITFDYKIRSDLSQLHQDGAKAASKYLDRDLKDKSLSIKQIRANVIDEAIHANFKRDVPNGTWKDYDKYREGFYMQVAGLLQERVTKLTPDRKKKLPTLGNKKKR